MDFFFFLGLLQFGCSGRSVHSSCLAAADVLRMVCQEVLSTYFSATTTQQRHGPVLLLILPERSAALPSLEGALTQPDRALPSAIPGQASHTGRHLRVSVGAWPWRGAEPGTPRQWRRAGVFANTRGSFLEPAGFRSTSPRLSQLEQMQRGPAHNHHFSNQDQQQRCPKDAQVPTVRLKGMLRVRGLSPGAHWA